MSEFIFESFESQDGDAFDLIYRPEQDRSRPIKISLTSEDNEEHVVHLSLADFVKALAAAASFSAKVADLSQNDEM